MQKISILLVVLCGTILSNAQSNKLGKFLIRGHVSDSIPVVYLQYVNLNGEFKKDSAIVTKNIFTFKGSVNCFHYTTKIIFKKYYDDHKFKLFEFRLGLENKPMQVFFKNDEFKIFGNTTEIEIRRFSKNNLLAIENSIGELEHKAFKNISDSTQLKDLKSKYKKRVYKYLKFHSDANAATYLVFTSLEIFYDDEWKTIFSMLSNAQQNSYYGIFFKKIVSRRELRDTQKKKPMINFRTLDSNGDSIDLYTLTQKGIVLIDFWATWCNPCRVSHPDLRRMYEKYSKRGFQIISVSCDALNNELKWKEVIIEDSIGHWPQILTNPTLMPKSTNRLNLLESLQIESFPTYMVVDTNNTLLGRMYTKEDLKNLLINIYGE